MTMLRARTFIIVFACVVVFGGIGAGVYVYRNHQADRRGQLNSSPNDAASIVAKAGKLILLPKNEAPTVMTVTNMSELSQQEFFRDAKNGDKVLIYPDAKKAYLYDPGADIIINVGPVTISSATSSASASGTP